LENKVKQLERLLVERVKELKCLFEISKICQEYDENLPAKLLQLSNQLKSGWEFPELLEVYIEIEEIKVGIFPKTKRILQSKLTIDNQDKGQILVYYPNDSIIFLDEEQDLLNQIGIEISAYIERFKQRERDKKIEEILRGNDRLNILSELTAGIAHELNTPLGSILGYSEILLKSEKENHKKKDLQKIISATKNAREIVKRLMYFSCEMPQQFSHLNMNELITENIGFLNRQLLEKSINLQFILDETIPLTRIDAVQFSQVLFNLVLNSINAVSHNGNITIQTKRQKEFIQLLISDDGIGISKENQANIFKPFFTTKPVGEGTGLGLSVVHGIVKAHNGTISLNSSEENGTTFNIQFPIN